LFLGVCLGLLPLHPSIHPSEAVLEVS
jgi:hypothetical protein